MIYTGVVPHFPLMPGSTVMMDEGYIGAVGYTLVVDQWAGYRLDIICAGSRQWKAHPITAAKLCSVRPLLRGWQKKETGVIDQWEKTVRYVWLLHCLPTETWIQSCNEGALIHDLCIFWTLLLNSACKHFLPYRSLRTEITRSSTVALKWHVTSSTQNEPMNTI